MTSTAALSEFSASTSTSNTLLGEKPSPSNTLKNHSLTSLVREIAKELSLQYEAYSQGWIISLTTKEGEGRVIYGYSFPVNNCTSAKVCSDKAAASDLMKVARIPHIRHRLFLNALLGDWAPKGGTQSQIIKFAEKHNYNLVLKPKEGTGGVNVHHIQNGRELDCAVLSLFSKNRDLVVSAYKAIQSEYRAIMLYGEPQLIYEKVIPSVKGDGKTTLSALISQYLSTLDSKRKDKILEHIDPHLLSSISIPPPGEQIDLHWKHNLGQGAFGRLLGGTVLPEFEKTPLTTKLSDLAIKTVQVLGINFASVDIVLLRNEPIEKKRFRVMEVNSGVMMQTLMEQHGERGVEIAMTIYKKAIEAMFKVSI